ncbi:MAG: hypothetical protein DRP78_00600 [Candidatus Omnitrophota bacterium]|nr:MAG: hypothetical protein DRP78_00600 [Candidatus Omnitrophota bacterium]
MKKIKVAVIGTGHLGKIHARIYSQLKNVELIGICDLNTTKVRKLALELQTNYFFDYKQLIDKTDAVSIATPTNQHYKIASAFLKAKVHVMVEKPICCNLK